MPETKKNKKPRRRFSPSIQAYIRKEKAKLRKEALNQEEYYKQVQALYQRFSK
jgi:hypothetical protein